MGRIHKRRKGNVNFGMAYNGYTIKADNKMEGVLSSSRQLDAFDYSSDIIQPPYEPKELIALIERNDTLKQNIEAIASNVSNFGHGIKYQDDFDYSNVDASLHAVADEEWEILRLLYKSINPKIDFGGLIYKAAIDMYSFGWGMIEILRNGKGQVAGAEYCRACNFRLVKNNESAVNIKVWEETRTSYEQVENRVRFKKFVQIINGKRVYFKEFGDPRLMDCESGEYSEQVALEKQATEIAYFPIHSPYTDYGVPYWINTAIIASGNILSEILNYKYFSDGRILPIAVTVSGGELTEASIQAIKEGKGIDNAYKMLILEAAPFEDENSDDKYLSASGNKGVSIDIKSLTDTNNSDALFRNYQLDGKEKIRDSMRLAPIYTGAATDYNRATADTARLIAEEQIFVPERKRICGLFNKIINNELSIKHCELYLKGPDLSNINEKANILSVLDKAGALTPNMLLPVVEKVLGRDIEPWEGEDASIPFELLRLQRGELKD